MDASAASEELRLQGNQAFGKGEFKKAAKIYRDALKLNLDPVILSNRAMCFIKLHEYSRARRDCEEGLKLHSPPNTQIKLSYRLGISTRELGELKKSKIAFENVLKLDPDNSAAAIALTELNTSVSIKVENVSTLPEEFIRILTGQEHQFEPVDSVTFESSEKVLKSVEELFIGQASGNSEKSPQTFTTKEGLTYKKSLNHEDSSTTSKPSMQYLAKLSRVPPHEKLGAYKLVLSIHPTDYQDIFHMTGVEGDFLNFYIEAATTLDTKDSQSWKTVWDVLSLFSKLPRYWLALLYCTPTHIEKFLSNAPSDKFAYFFNSSR